MPAIAAASRVPTANAQTSNTVRIGVIPSDFAAQAYYAKDRGLFRQAGLDIEIQPLNSGAAIASAISSGSLDFGYSSIVSLAIAHAKGFPYKIVAVANIYDAKAPAGGLLSVKTSSPLHTAKDFDGKIVAVGALDNITELGPQVWLDANGGDSKTVRWTEVPIVAMAPAVIAGRVDAAVMDLGVYPTLGKPGNPLRVVAETYTAIAPTFAIGGWFSTAGWIARHAAQSRAFATAMTQAAVWANAHHHESAIILANYLKESATQIDHTLRYTYGTELTPQLVQSSIDASAKYYFAHTFPARELLDGA